MSPTESRGSELDRTFHSDHRLAMDSFDNFQYESASSYGGGIGIVDDTSSVYTANTADNASSVDLSSLSISDDYNHPHPTANGHAAHVQSVRSVIDEDFDAVLDDLKD